MQTPRKLLLSGFAAALVVLVVGAQHVYAQKGARGGVQGRGGVKGHAGGKGHAMSKSAPFRNVIDGQPRFQALFGAKGRPRPGGERSVFTGTSAHRPFGKGHGLSLAKTTFAGRTCHRNRLFARDV